MCQGSTLSELHIDYTLLSFACFQGMYFSEDLRLHRLLNYFWILSLSLGIFQPFLSEAKNITTFIIQLLSINITGVLQAHIVMLIPCKWQKILMAITVWKFSVCLGSHSMRAAIQSLFIILRCSPERLSALCSTHVHQKQD